MNRINHESTLQSNCHVINWITDKLGLRYTDGCGFIWRKRFRNGGGLAGGEAGRHVAKWPRLIGAGVSRAFFGDVLIVLCEFGFGAFDLVIMAGRFGLVEPKNRLLEKIKLLNRCKYEN